jgi:4'-phosphopantetheinyl transferase
MPALEETVSVWWCSLASPADGPQRAVAWLSTAEIERANRFGTTALRERYIIGRATLRLLLGTLTGRAPPDVPIVRGHRGRPMLAREPRLDFNVSHTGDVALFAIATHLPAGMRLGVDIEHAAREVNVDRLARRLLTASERGAMADVPVSQHKRRFLATWTCKEAMSKATGDGLAAPFGRIAVNPLPEPVLLDGPPPYEPDRWELHRVPMRPEYVASIALHQTPSQW